MPEKFDPYFKWLGIPPDEQPPTLYRLLGIRPLTDDADVIENAADQRMAHLRTVSTGKYAEISQKLLNQIALAKVTLLSSEKKAAYDARLRAKINSATQEPIPPTAQRPGHQSQPKLKTRKAQPLTTARGQKTQSSVRTPQESGAAGPNSLSALGDIAGSGPARATRRAKPPAKPLWQQPAGWVGASALFLALAVGVLYLRGQRGGQQVADSKDAAAVQVNANAAGEDRRGASTDAGSDHGKTSQDAGTQVAKVDAGLKQEPVESSTTLHSADEKPKEEAAENDPAENHAAENDPAETEKGDPPLIAKTAKKLASSIDPGGQPGELAALKEKVAVDDRKDTPAPVVPATGAASSQRPAQGETEPEAGNTPKLGADALEQVGYYELFETRKPGDPAVALATLHFAEDGKVHHQQQGPIAEWDVEADALVVRYLDAGQGAARLKEDGHAQWSGTLSRVDETLHWRLRPVVVVAVWEILYGTNFSRRTLYSNGRMGEPLGEGRWTVNGNAISFGSSEPCTVSDGGRYIEGRQPGGGTMSGRLISRNVDIDFGPLPRDETAFEMQEKISKLPLKPRVPIEQQLPGAYELIGATTDGSKELHLTIDLSEDQQVSEHGQKIGVWSLSGRELELKLDYEAAGPIVVRRKQAETFIGSDKWEDGSTWKWQLQRVLPVAVWNIAIAEKVSQQTLYSNGRVNSPHAIASSAYWFLKGDGIKFNWGHFQFGPNRRTFAGRRAGGAPVKGQLVSVRQ